MFSFSKGATEVVGFLFNELIMNKFHLYLTKTNFGSQIALKWICLMEEPYEKNL
jgi:hypothetical protein